MEKINQLLLKLNNQVPAGIAKQIDGLKLLNQKLSIAQNEFESDPTEENKEYIEEIKDFIEDSEESVIDSLEALLEKKIEKENEELEKEAISKRQNEARILKEKENKLQSEKKAKEEAEKAEKEKEKKKSGIGAFGLIFGGVLLIGSLGAINYFKNNK
jgi:hypothetical protein